MPPGRTPRCTLCPSSWPARLSRELCTRVRRRVILRTSPSRSSRKYASNQVNNSATDGCSRAWQKCAAEDEQAPLLAEDVEWHADGTPSAVGLGHRTLRTTDWITGAVPYPLWVGCETQ